VGDGAQYSNPCDICPNPNPNPNPDPNPDPNLTPSLGTPWATARNTQRGGGSGSPLLTSSFYNHIRDFFINHLNSITLATALLADV
jgi:hypothetical protein